MIAVPQSRRRVRTRNLPRLNGRMAALLGFLAALVWSLVQAGVFSGDRINEGGWGQAANFVRAAVRPDFSPEVRGLLVHSALVTLSYAVCGILSSETWWRLRSGGVGERGRGGGLAALPYLTARGALAIPRAIHEAIWGLFFINILGLDPLSAVLAIAIPFGAITAKVFAEIFDETPPEPLRVIAGSGAPPLAAFLYGLLPRAFPYLLSYALYRFECALRSAAVLGLIGAGGLGYQILLSLQSLRYEQVWTFLYALILLVGLTDAWSSFLNRRLNVSSATGLHAAPNNGRATASVNPPSAGTLSPEASLLAPPLLGAWGAIGLRLSLLAAGLLIPFVFWYVRADWLKPFTPRAQTLLAGVIEDSFPPAWAPGLLADLTVLSAQTLAMSILAMTVAGLGGLLLSFPAAANFALPGGLFDGGGGRGRLLGALPGLMPLLLTRGALLVARALSESIWVLLVLFVLFPGILPGAIGLGLYNLGVLGRLMAEVTENMDQRPLRALLAQGASPAQVFFYGVLPATLPRNVSYILYRWEVCIRATAVVGIVGAGGLGRHLAEQLARFDYPAVMTILLFFMGLTFVVDCVSTLVRRTLR